MSSSFSALPPAIGQVGVLWLLVSALAYVATSPAVSGKGKWVMFACLFTNPDGFGTPSP